METQTQQYPSTPTRPERSPKKQLRWDIMVIVLVLLGMFVGEFFIVLNITSFILIFSPEFWSMTFEAVGSGTPDMQALLGNTEMEQLNADITVNYMGVMMFIAALATLPLVLIIRGTKLFKHDLVVVNQKAKLSSIIKILVLMLGASYTVVLVSMALDPLLEQLGLSLTEALESTISQVYTSPIGILHVMIFGPIMEEIIFRGAILNRLTRHGYNFAIVVSALMFGLYHGIIIQGIYAFFIGILLAYVALRYSLKWAMVLHIINNSISTGFYMLENAGIGIAYDILNWSFVAIFIVAALILVILKRKQFAPMRQNGLPVTPEPFRVAFTSPFMIIYAIFFLGLGVITTMLSAILSNLSPEGIP